MDFFAHQALARRQSRWLVLAFSVSVLLISGLLVLVCAGIVWLQRSPTLHEARWGLLVAGMVPLLLMLLGSWLRIAELDGAGGVGVAQMLGGSPVPAVGAALEEQRLRNVVEELAIAAGIPPPSVFVLRKELGINAFAAGLTLADAALCVTWGALRRLSRAELQAVVGHEMSHILNGDMRLNLRLLGVVSGLVMLDEAGYRLRNLGEAGSSGRVVNPLFWVLGKLVGALGSAGAVLGRLITHAISRHREYLADASSVQFTRDPLALAGALKKVAVIETGSGLHHPSAGQVRHMLFAPAVSALDGGGSHPPLFERIRRLDASFDPDQLPEHALLWNAPDYDPDAHEAPTFPRGTVAFAPAVAAPVKQRVAQPGPRDLAVAVQRHQALPERLVRLAGQPDTAAALVCALLMDYRVPATAAAQRAVLEAHWGIAGVAAINEMAPLLLGLPPELQLPLACQAFASLRIAATPRLQRLRDCVRALGQADGHINLLEYACARLLSDLLRQALEPPRAPGRLLLRQCEAELQLLFAVLARASGGEEWAARQAAGAALIPLGFADAAVPTPPEDWPQRLDVALDRLQQLRPSELPGLLESMSQCVQADGRIAIAEAELLRTVALSLGCPLPPLFHTEA